MRQRLAAVGRRLFLGHTTAVAYLALVLASSGVTYAAATIGSAEVINNSLRSIDMADGLAVGGVDVVNDSITGADVRELSLKGVGRKLQWITPTLADPEHRTIATIGRHTFKGNCFEVRSVWQGTVFVNGPAGDAQLSSSMTENDLSAGGMATEGRSIAAGADEAIAGVRTFAGEFARSVGTAWIRSGTTMIQVEFHFLADARDGVGYCQLYASVTELV